MKSFWTKALLFIFILTGVFYFTPNKAEAASVLIGGPTWTTGCNGIIFLGSSDSLKYQNDDVSIQKNLISPLIIKDPGIYYFKSLTLLDGACGSATKIKLGTKTWPPNSSLTIVVKENLTMSPGTIIESQAIGNLNFRLEVGGSILLNGNNRISLSGAGSLGGASGLKRPGFPRRLATNGSGFAGGFGAGNGTSPDFRGSNGGGGTHAGIGGPDGFGRVNPNTYGNSVKPLDHGSGGGGGFDCKNQITYGGNGGGAMQIIAKEITFGANSYIDANGGDAQGSSYTGNGGGSGGSVLVYANQLNTGGRSSIFQANGGWGSQGQGSDPGCVDNSWTFDGSGGGGGRVAIYAGNSSLLSASIASVEKGHFVGGLGREGAAGGSAILNYGLADDQFVFISDPQVEDPPVVNEPPRNIEASITSNLVLNPGIRFKAVDPEGKNLTYSYSIDTPLRNLVGGSAASGAWTGYTYAHGNLSAGSHLVYVKVADPDGGVAYYSWPFTISVPAGNIIVNLNNPPVGGGYVLKKPDGTVINRNVSANFPGMTPGGYSVTANDIVGYSTTVTPASGTLLNGGSLIFNVSYAVSYSIWNFGIRQTRLNRGGVSAGDAKLVYSSGGNTFKVEGSVRVGDIVYLDMILRDSAGNNQPTKAVAWVLKDSSGKELGRKNVTAGETIILTVPSKSGKYTFSATFLDGNKVITGEIVVPALKEITPE